MSTLSRAVPSAPTRGQALNKVLDLLPEMVVLTTDPADRAELISGLLGELCAAIEWLHQPEVATCHEAYSREVASLRRLMAGAYAHQRRMQIRGPVDSARWPA